MTPNVNQAVAKMDAWLETMRDSDGYTGPISHWWESSLIYTGKMADWRYEGILGGYLILFNTTGNPCWLEKAVTAGNDLISAQLPSGSFRNSSFQQGPMEGGTPHEVAADVGLFHLVKVLRDQNDERSERFFEAAERNLQEYQIGRLWSGNGFRDQPWNNTFVPNKNATTIEALILYELLTGQSMEEYIEGAVKVVLRGQVTDRSKPYLGGVTHLGTGKQQLKIGIYTARSASALVKLYEHTNQAKYLQSAQEMGNFLIDLVDENGTQFGYYPDGRRVLSPTWISPSGDVLRALLLLRSHTNISDQPIDLLVQRFLNDQMPTGGLPTARGLGQKGSTQLEAGLPDFRDVLPVVGWCDKAFRGLTMLADINAAPTSDLLDTEIPCIWKGQRCLYQESVDTMVLREAQRRRVLYQWQKTASYPTVYEL